VTTVTHRTHLSRHVWLAGLTTRYDWSAIAATMEIMGRWNWWLPKPLARILPRADFEAGSTEQVPAPA